MEIPSQYLSAILVAIFLVVGWLFRAVIQIDKHQSILQNQQVNINVTLEKISLSLDENNKMTHALSNKVGEIDTKIEFMSK